MAIYFLKLIVLNSIVKLAYIESHLALVKDTTKKRLIDMNITTES